MTDEHLILVDEDNRRRGVSEKLAAHRDNLLHRAFSIFVVDTRGGILLQQRNPAKYHSGGLWANSCCGHPRPGEHTAAAAQRRLREELGIDVPLSFGFRARYQVAFDNGLHENELIAAYFGPLRMTPQPDPAEVSAVIAATPRAIRRRIADQPEAYAFWLRHYFAKHFTAIERLTERMAHKATVALPQDG